MVRATACRALSASSPHPPPVSRSWLTLNQSSSDWEVAIARKIAEAHLERIGGTWRFRLGVPTALRPIVGKREFRVSLKTSNLKEAKQRAHAECLKAGKTTSRIL